MLAVSIFGSGTGAWSTNARCTKPVWDWNPEPLLLLGCKAGWLSFCWRCRRASCPAALHRVQGNFRDIQRIYSVKISARFLLLVIFLFVCFLDFCWGRASSLRHIRTGDSNIPESGHWAFRPSFKSSIEKEEKWWSWIVSILFGSSLHCN